MRSVLAAALGPLLFATGCSTILGGDFSDLQAVVTSTDDASIEGGVGIDSTVDSSIEGIDAADSGIDGSIVEASTETGNSDAPAADSSGEESGDASDAAGTCAYNPMNADAAGIASCIEYWRPQGLEMLTLSAYDNGSGGTLFAAAFAQSTAQHTWSHDLTHQQALDTIASKDLAGYRPSQISTAGSPLRYTILWIPKEGPTIAELDVPWGTFTSEFFARNSTLVSAEVYSDGTQPLFAPIWVDLGSANTSGYLDSYFSAKDANADAKNFTVPLVSISVLHDATAGDWYTTLRDSAPGAWAYRLDYGLIDIQSEVGTFRKNGWQLRHIAVTRLGANAVFSGAWSNP